MIDYEAALDAFVLAQAQITNGVYHPKTGQLIREAMIRAVVAAALGDEPLYQEPVERCRHWERVDYGPCASCGAQERWVVQVYPEVTDDE